MRLKIKKLKNSQSQPKLEFAVSYKNSVVIYLFIFYVNSFFLFQSSFRSLTEPGFQI